MSDQVWTTDLGVIPVDCGDVVAFSVDALIYMIMDNGYTRDEAIGELNGFIAQYGGISCGFAADGCYGMTSVKVVHENGDIYNGCLVGGGPVEDISHLATVEEYEQYERELKAQLAVKHGNSNASPSPVPTAALPQATAPLYELQGYDD